MEHFFFSKTAQILFSIVAHFVVVKKYGTTFIMESKKKDFYMYSVRALLPS